MSNSENAQDLNEIIAELEEKCRELPDNVMAIHHLAVVYRKAGRNADALEMLEKCIKLDPHSVESHINIGAIHFESGNLDKAKEMEAVTGQPHYVIKFYDCDSFDVTSRMPMLGEWYTSDGLQHGA